MDALRASHSKFCQSAPQAFGQRHSLAAGVLWVCVLGLLAVSPHVTCAQPVGGQGATPANRYLLIVDVSRAMEPRQRSMLKAVQDLLASGMGGQMQAGDTLGVWTYNTNLYAGRPIHRLQRSPIRGKRDQGGGSGSQ